MFNSLLFTAKISPSAYTVLASITLTAGKGIRGKATEIPSIVLGGFHTSLSLSFITTLREMAFVKMYNLSQLVILHVLSEDLIAAAMWTLKI